MARAATKPAAKFPTQRYTCAWLSLKLVLAVDFHVDLPNPNAAHVPCSTYVTHIPSRLMALEPLLKLTLYRSPKYYAHRKTSCKSCREDTLRCSCGTDPPVGVTRATAPPAHHRKTPTKLGPGPDVHAACGFTAAAPTTYIHVYLYSGIGIQICRCKVI